MVRSRLRLVTCLAMALAIAGCSSKNGDSAQCTAEGEKAALLATAQDWYLFLDLLPSGIDPARHTSAQDLLNFLTATAYEQGKDRHWSYIAPKLTVQQYYEEGKSAGFGFRGKLLGNQLFVTQVMAGSAAAENGFHRGDEILEVGPSQESLVPVSALIAQGALDSTLGISQEGVTRFFKIRTTGIEDIRSVTTRTFSLDPVPNYTILNGVRPVGYVNLRTFITPAEEPLRTAFAEFKTNSVTDIIVDLRYNGGGLISTSEVLANLLAADRADQVMFKMQYNTRHSEQNTTTLFAKPALPQAVTAQRIAFIVTDRSASASELVVNALAPYARVALIGSHTYGKPVSQRLFENSSCQTVLFLVAAKIVNKNDFGDYFEGLGIPDSAFQGICCQADDDLNHDQGNPNEQSTKVALDWLISDTCSTLCPPPEKQLRISMQSEFPVPPEPLSNPMDLPSLIHR